ncbi:TRAP transporter substrate-binding protein [uncultured Sphaerochaeta sp.]|uniref:TRAP transporter substrate-binding protein n=1 Tax=uncultured Sphaerochaeta sp. TaxID=886478 RepID=UPI002A0A7B4E|nr:TRAP transporter substrate-binding protein [uncultured Sphaerochaeta sp.]
MKRLVCVGIMLAMILVSLVANGATEQPKKEGTDKVYVYKFGHSMTEESARHKSMVYFKEELEKRSNGRIQVELYANSLLGNESEMMDMVKINAIQGTRGSQFEKANPQYLIYNLPFIFENSDEFRLILDSPFEQRIAKVANKNGYYIAATGIAGGYRQITNNRRPIKTVEDIKGLKLRVPPLEPVLKAIEALQANPAQVPYNETYMALKTGVVDGQENPPSNIVDMKFYEVQKYLSIVNYIICPDCLFTSNEWYQSLPADLQKIFNEVSKETMKKSTDIWLAAEEANLTFLGQHLEVNTVTPENLSKFREKVAPVWQYFIDKGAFTQADVDEIQSRLKSVR